MARNLVFQTAFIGDVLLSIPLMKAIREYYPNDELFLFCRKELRELFDAYDLVDKVIVANKKKKSDWSKSIAELTSYTYENVFCPHQSLRSAFALNKINAKNKIGYSLWWNSYFFDHRIERPMKLPEALRQLALLAAVNSDFRKKFNAVLLKPEALSSMTQESFKVFLPKADFDLSMEFEESLPPPPTTKTRIGLAPGSVWNTKRWDKFAELAADLDEKGYEVVLMGSKAELPICDRIEAVVPRVDNQCGQGSILDAYESLKGLDLVVTNDSGLMHLACSSGTPVVSIFGPTVPALGYQPWGSKACIVQKPLSCRPCGLHGHKKCPIGTHDCMKQITVTQVVQSIKQMMTT